MTEETDKTLKILERAGTGDPSAFEELFSRHRAKLRRAIAARMDRRVTGRADASDILQETHLEAFKRLPNYLEQKGMPFYAWLYWIAREKVLEMHRRHLGAQKRTVRYEVPLMPADSSAKFVKGLIGSLPSPSQELARAELAAQLHEALEQLDPDESDLILWRHFEQLRASDMAQLLNITEAAANKRYLRAVEHLLKILNDLGVSKPGK